MNADVAVTALLLSVVVTGFRVAPAGSEANVTGASRKNGPLGEAAG